LSDNERLAVVKREQALARVAPSENDDDDDDDGESMGWEESDDMMVVKRLGKRF
jgi:hypothetical protein